MTIDPQTRMVDLGERRVISEILTPRYGGHGHRFGDDCAVVQSNAVAGETYVASTDPCPEPLPAHFGYTDLFYWGWLLATINLSDLAAAGATPRTLLTSLILPNDTLIADFVRLLDGIDECAHMFGAEVVGGNLKEGPRIDLVATAFGATSGPPLSRHGARPGDMLAVVGTFGTYWAGALSVARSLGGSELGPLHEAVLQPKPMVAAGMALQQSGVVTGCIDNSDGLYAAVMSLARMNNIGFDLTIDDTIIDRAAVEVAERLQIDPIRLGLGFGDWNLVCCFPAAERVTVEEAMRTAGAPIRVLGVATDRATVTLSYHGKSGLFRAVDSERFREASMFTAGIDSYIEALLSAPYMVEEP